MFAAMDLHSDAPEITRGLAAQLGAVLQAGDVVALSGDLGAGKTCFVQGLAAGMGIQGHVTSPTFILMRYHPGPLPLWHADAYRLGSAEEFADLGLDEVLRSGVLAVEWAARVEAALPEDHIEVVLEGEDDDRRSIRLIAHGPRSGEALMRMLTSALGDVGM